MCPLVAPVPIASFHNRGIAVNTYKICFHKDINESAFGPVTELPRHTHISQEKGREGGRCRRTHLGTQYMCVWLRGSDVILFALIM